MICKKWWQCPCIEATKVVSAADNDEDIDADSVDVVITYLLCSERRTL